MSKGFSYTGVPGWRHLPNKNNREIWRLEKEINMMILKVVNERIGAQHGEKDLLQMILEAAKSSSSHNGKPSMDINSDKFIVDNCKNIYFAGNETTAVTASWALVLLATHPDWQARARAEVLEICKGRLPDADMLRRMKTLAMVIQETLRLYPVVHS
ncbi:Cytochrome P450 714C2 [Vitis vinifera]|uniref:Cytochrome P450 714C2 n=1 Tax=Vitis vinifera TaxID=29760 RepID=A0A438IET3_VITVI|nr:Cytochrome P450 714C2 [Vitis vinifera]